jgi:hypothetical protein
MAAYGAAAIVVSHGDIDVTLDMRSGCGAYTMIPEENRNARRDRKRKTRMVVDNAGVKRIIAALKLKRAKR